MKLRLLQNLPLFHVVGSVCTITEKRFILCLHRTRKRWLVMCVLNVSNLTNITLCSLQSKYFCFILDTVHHAFSEKEGTKMLNFELLFLQGFSSKNYEILHKDVLTPQEYEYYYKLEKMRKNKKKPVGGRV